MGKGFAYYNANHKKGSIYLIIIYYIINNYINNYNNKIIKTNKNQIKYCTFLYKQLYISNKRTKQ